MRVGVDGYNLAMANGTGVAAYGVELIEALHSLGHEVEGVFGIDVPANETLRETMFFNALHRAPDKPRTTNRYRRAWRTVRSLRRPHLRTVPVGGDVEKSFFAGEMPRFDRMVSAGRLFDDAFRSFRLTGRMVRLSLPQPPEVMHWTYPVPLMIPGIPNVYTLHDLVPLKLPYATLDNKLLYGRLVAKCIDVAAQICTVSESSKRDIVDRFGVDPARITNTYQTARAGAVVTDPLDDARAVEGIMGLRHRGYFLYVGAIEPKKNVGRLIEACLSLQSETPLVIVGARAWQSEAELRLMPGDGASGAAGTFRGPRGQTIVRLDYLPRDLLDRLIRGAKALVFPSLYEGFGLPVLEAMKLGTPVITSATSSLPEVVGEAGLLVDPYDATALMQAMRRLDTDAGLGSAMALRGLEQAKLFSRERYRERLTDLYRAAMAPR